ncbi:MAG: hypothetical protein VCC20_15050 [Myxococcota bacterium]
MMAHSHGCWIGALGDPPAVVRPFFFLALEQAFDLPPTEERCGGRTAP